MSILWVLIRGQRVKYSHLPGCIEDQLESTTVEAWARGRRGDPAASVSIVDTEVACLEREIQIYDRGHSRGGL